MIAGDNSAVDEKGSMCSRELYGSAAATLEERPSLEGSSKLEAAISPSFIDFLGVGAR